MTIGCLSGSGRGAAIDGTYSYCVPGRMDPLPPDRGADVQRGPTPFTAGVLTDGDAATQVAWASGSVGEVGVDIVVELGERHFVDRVLVHQPGSEEVANKGPSAAAAVAAGDIESIGHVEPAGLSRVEVYAACGGDSALSLVGHAGQRGSETFPEGPVTVCAGVEADQVIVRLISFQRDIRLTGLEVWGAALGEPRVFPVPAKMETLKGPEFALDRDSQIAITPSASEGARFAAELLSEKVSERFGLQMAVVASDAVRSDLAICVGAPGTAGEVGAAPPDPEAAAISVGGPGTTPPPADEPESYAVRVEAAGATIAAHGRRGLVYGVEALLQLLERRDDGGSAAVAADACLIEDTPRLAFRGAHLFLPARDQIDYFKRLVRYLLAPMRINTIFLELAGAMQLDRRPEIAEAWERQNRLAAEGKAAPVPHGEVCGGGTLTKAEVRDLVEFARSYGIEVIPEIQSHSHVQYLTMTYPQIAEAPSDDGYPDSYCPLHPDSHRIVFDIIDEVVELLGPLRYLHMGHDEIYTMAECPRCRDKSRDELFAHDVKALHGYLKEKGVGMMVWADMLQPWQRYAGTESASAIPKDIIMLEFVWYFRPWADTEDLLLENGFQVIYGNCYSSHFTRYERRTTKPGVIGTQVSVWSGTNEEDMGRLGKLYDLVYSANTAWTAHCQDELRWVYDRRIADLLPDMRAQLRDETPRSARGQAPPTRALDLSRHLTAPRRNESGTYGAWDLTRLPEANLMWRGLPFQLGDGVLAVESATARGGQYPGDVTVPIGGPAAAVIFAHTAAGVGRIPDPFGARQVIARYEVAYADGGEESVDVAYGHHVAEWNRRHGAPLGPTFHRHAGYVATWPVDPLWQGKTATGEDITLYAMEWTNPHPGKEIRSIRVAAADPDAEVALLVLGITVVGPGG